MVEMTASTTAVARCDDGTEIAFRWVYDDAPEYEWNHDRSHWPGPITPMEASLRHLGWPGEDRAWDEIGMEPMHVFRRFQLVGPFLYARMTPYPMERLMNIAARYQQVRQEFGGTPAFWQRYCEPRIRQACADIAAMPAGASLVAAAELWGYGFHQTFTSAALLGVPGFALTALLTQYAGDDATLLTYEVTQGGENASQAIDGEIWELAELARKSPAARKVLSGAPEGALAALRTEPGAAELVAAFDALIVRHGHRAQGWHVLAKTWEEEPEAALALVRAQLEGERTSPEELRERTATIRREATERALGLLPAEKHGEFWALLEQLDGYVYVREGRAYWQMVITGAMRGLLLRTGAQLASQGRIDNAEDVFFLAAEDVAGGAADLRAVVKERRAEWERLHHVRPPEFIGTPGEMAAAAAKLREELRGLPASRGQVTAPARVLQGPEEGARLQPGDVLVCVMTTPAWTPLFAIAGGIVTESGGALSHPAITAREYGIPAVVALDGATKRIRDGQTVTVDGGAGTVAPH
jgi:pyruvate,water dikinase